METDDGENSGGTNSFYENSDIHIHMYTCIHAYMHYSTVQYSTVQYTTLHYITYDNNMTTWIYVAACQPAGGDYRTRAKHVTE